MTLFSTWSCTHYIQQQLQWKAVASAALPSNHQSPFSCMQNSHSSNPSHSVPSKFGILHLSRYLLSVRCPCGHCRGGNNVDFTLHRFEQSSQLPGGFLNLPIGPSKVCFSLWQQTSSTSEKSLSKEIQHAPEHCTVCEATIRRKKCCLRRRTKRLGGEKALLKVRSINIACQSINLHCSSFLSPEHTHTKRVKTTMHNFLQAQLLFSASLCRKRRT